jgi:hypothetical protein
VIRCLRDLIDGIIAASATAVEYCLWAYIDDLNIGVPFSIVNHICHGLQTIFGTDFRISVNSEKTCLTGNAALMIENPIFQVRPHGQIIIGVPTGTDTYCKEVIMQKIQQAISSLPSMEYISPWSTWLLLRYCVVARIGYLARAVEPKMTQDAFKWFDDQIDETLFKLVGNDIVQHESDFHGALVLSLRSQPLAQGGLGIQRYSGLAGEVACVKSRGLLATFLIERLPSLVSTALSGWSPVYLGATEEPNLQDEGIPFLTSHSRTTSPLGDILSEEVFNSLSNEIKEAISDARDARLVSHSIYSRRSSDLVTLLNELQRPALAQYLQSSRFKGSGRWLAGKGSPIFYGPFGFRSTQEYIIALRLRLLLPPTSSTALGGAIACSCGEIYLHDDLPFHYMDCIRMPKLHKQRHNLLRDTLCSFLKSASPNVDCTITTEAIAIRNNQDLAVSVNGDTIGDGNALLSPNNMDDITQHRIDIAVTGLNRLQYIDITVVNSSARSYLTSGHQLNGHAVNSLSSQSYSYAVLERERQKRERLRGLLGNRVDSLINFVPFVVEITGKVGPASTKLLEAVDLIGWSSGIYLAQVGSIIARYNAMIFSQWLRTKCA